MNGYFSPIPTLSLLGAWASVSVVDGIEAGVSALRRPHDGLTDRHTPTATHRPPRANSLLAPLAAPSPFSPSSFVSSSVLPTSS